MTKPRIHLTPDNVDAELAGALGHYVNAICGYRWIPTRFGAECDGLPHCEICFPPVKEKRRSGPRPAVAVDQPHYVYRCYDAAGRLLYVGCSNNPVKRIAEHKARAWWGKEMATTRFLVFPDRRYALSKEREAIATEMPLCNVKGKWPYRTDAWTADDYVDLRRAIVQTIETTHKVYGKHTLILLAEIDAELHARFGVTAIDRRPA